MNSADIFAGGALLAAALLVGGWLWTRPGPPDGWTAWHGQHPMPEDLTPTDPVLCIRFDGKEFSCQACEVHWQWIDNPSDVKFYRKAHA